MSGSHESTSHDSNESARPRVTILLDPHLAKRHLALVLRAAGHDVLEVYPNAPPDTLMGPASRDPDVILATVGDEASLRRIQELRAIEPVEKVPLLGLLAPKCTPPDRERLLDLGIVGLVATGAHADHIVYRVDLVVRQLRERRQRERVGTLLPVEVEALGRVTTEFIVSLSAGGAGIASTRRLEPNTDVSLLFLDEELESVGSVRGRVARLAQLRDCLPGFRVGVVFYPLPEEIQAILEDEIQRMLVPSVS